MQRVDPEYSISRRAALLGASAVATTAGLPAIAKAAESEAGGDAELIALAAELARNEDAFAATRAEVRRLERAIEARLPEPPDHAFSSGLNLKGSRKWLEFAERLYEGSRQSMERQYPDAREMIARNYARMLAELRAYAAACERRWADPELTAAKAELSRRVRRRKELVTRIIATPAKSPASVLAKVRAITPYARWNMSIASGSWSDEMIVSMTRDLERLAATT